MKKKNIFYTLLLTSALFALPVMAQDAQKNSDQENTAAENLPRQDNSQTYQMLNLFGDVFERTRESYVDPVTDKKLIESALNGMLMNLDPHSGYLSEDDFKDMQVQTRGEFGGLGIEVTTENGLVKVVTPIDETPAAKAGIKAADLITHLDGKPILGLTLEEAVEKMRGRVGSVIEITVRREGVNEPLKFKLVRDVIKIQSVRNRIEGNVGYIRINSFSQTTYPGLEKAVKDIQAKLGNKLKGYVLDLRNNPGGLLDQAIAVSDAFLEKGEIVSTRGREEDDTKRDNATAGDITSGKPIVVLINEGSASAAEIVAGALQDHRRAILMGEKSFGKGSVQTVIPIAGHGAMRLTTARYYTPSGRSIQAKGIEPDIQVKLAKIEEIGSEGLIHEADLKGALVNPQDAKAEQPATKSIAPDQVQAAPKDESLKTEGDKKDEKLSDAAKQDYQLRRALDLVEGIALYVDGEKDAATIPAPAKSITPEKPKVPEKQP